MLSPEHQNYLDKIMQEAEQRKKEYYEREKLGIGHTKFFVLSPNCLEPGTGGSIWAGETYDREEARAIFYKAWGCDNGKPMVHYSLDSGFVYPDNFADKILPWLSQEDDCYHWSATFQRGRFTPNF